MNVLKYLERNEIKNEMDKLLFEYFKILNDYEGRPCKSCGFIQGTSANGFKKDYCDHITSKVDRKLKERKEEIAGKAITFLVSQDMQIIL